jgi:hypothetical protein
MVKTLTSANNVLVLAVPGLFDVAQHIQGFANDDAFNFSDPETGETLMGVDGILSFGWIPAPFDQTIMLQADSNSIQFFDDWYMGEQQAREKLPASGTVQLPSIGKTYNLVRGVLKSPSIVPGVKKLLQPRKFVITWNFVQPANL